MIPMTPNQAFDRGLHGHELNPPYGIDNSNSHEWEAGRRLAERNHAMRHEVQQAPPTDMGGDGFLGIILILALLFGYIHLRAQEKAAENPYHNIVWPKPAPKPEQWFGLRTSKLPAARRHKVAKRIGHGNSKARPKPSKANRP
jgi:hypothetical protein